MSDKDSFNYSLFEEPAQTNAPVECLGMTFETEAARRAYFIEKLREKLKDPEFRQTEGFPIGSDEDILALSDPPYYTACPNPFLKDFIQFYSKPYNSAVPYHIQPFAADVSEGKSDPIYSAHSYHTKVPHKAIMRYILHYTQPGDVVLDGFSGTGMTGVAAQLCGDKSAIQELGYLISQDNQIYDNFQQDPLGGSVPFSAVGPRLAVLNDLSPAAAFITYNYNAPIQTTAFVKAARKLLKEFETAYGWMYETNHTVGQDDKGRINFTIWSDVFLCNNCQGEIVFWAEAVENGETKDKFICPNCKAIVEKRSLDRVQIKKFDPVTRTVVLKPKRVPVSINYSYKGERFDKIPDEDDIALLERIEKETILHWYPTNRIDLDIDLWYERDYRSLGIYRIDDFFYTRSLIMLAFLRQRVFETQDARIKTFLWFWVESVLMSFSLMNRYRKAGFSQVNQILSGTLYVGAILAEVSPWYALDGKIKRLGVFDFIKAYSGCVSNSSSTGMRLPENSIDYIFTDPPFGSNIIYSDLSILWESWLRVSTNTKSEAVVHRRKKENAIILSDYAEMMSASFKNMYYALKPGRWMTVEFHNSKNSVWVAIQEALEQAGFVIADVRTLDKQQGSFKQVTSSGAVKQDLIISAYKPNGGLEHRFTLEAGTEAGAWDFVRNHLGQLPVFVSRSTQIQYVVERQNYLLYDRMVAFHVQRGKTVPLSAGEFYEGLAQRFAERDGMYFLPEQVVEYDKKRLLAGEVQQIPLIVVNEADAIQWLRQTLSSKPQTYSDLYTQFVNQLQTIDKHEKLPELSLLLEQNFLRYDGQGDVPSQIHAYLSTNFEELLSLPKDHPSLRLKAKDRWYVPDPNKSADLEKVREKALLKEFNEYRSFTGRQLTQFRLEAVRVGFRKAWQENDYPTIIQVSQKIPEDVLLEDPKLMMWYDQALTRSGK
jgi:DNA modification methylase